MEREALKLAQEALEEIALAGMSPAPETNNTQEAFHARQAWRFIGTAARALERIKEALAQPALAKREWNFCERCGKRTKDIHTCTPPSQENT